MRVSFSAYRRRWPFRIALWFAPIFVVLMMISVRMSLDASALNQEIETTATVVQRFTREVPGRRRSHTEHVLVLSFHTKDGAQRLVDYTPGIRRYDATQLGEPITLYYAPDDPDVVEYEAGRTAGGAASATKGVWITGVILLGLMMVTWLTTGAMRRALRNDKIYPATVTRHRRAFSIRKRYRMDFEDHHGMRGRTHAVPAGALVPIGRALPVLVDPRSGRSMALIDVLA